MRRWRAKPYQDKTNGIMCKVWRMARVISTAFTESRISEYYRGRQNCRNIVLAVLSFATIFIDDKAQYPRVWTNTSGVWVFLTLTNMNKLLIPAKTRLFLRRRFVTALWTYLAQQEWKTWTKSEERQMKTKNEAKLREFGQTLITVPDDSQKPPWWQTVLSSRSP